MIDSIKGHLIVSCQALPDEPLHSSFIMSRMALAAKQGGARGIRANSVEDIREIKKTVHLPIIGIIKKDYDDSPVYITPTLKEVDDLVETGVDIIAIDATSQMRPGHLSIDDFFKMIKEKYPHQRFMADCSTVEEALHADQLGFDFIGTTLVGYTPQSRDMHIEENDFEIIKTILSQVKHPVIAEGNIDTPLKAKRVLELGCYSVVVGSIITRPQVITKRFTDIIEGGSNMNGFMDKLAEKMLPLAQKLAANRYLAAIRDSFVTILPMIIGCSIFTLLNCVFLGEGNYFDQWFGIQANAIVDMGNAICSAGMNVIALLLVFLVAKHLSDYYEEDSMTMAVTAVVAFLIITPFGSSDEAGEFIRTYYLGAAGFFTAFIAAIATVEVMRRLMKVKALIIKMPDSVPTGIARSFNSMIPVILTMIIFGLVRLLTNALGMPLNDLIFNWIQQPLSAIITSPIGLVVVYVFYMLLWGFGIHSAYIIGPIIEPIYLVNLTANAELISKGAAASSILTKPFTDSLMFMGGAGNMIALIIAIFIVSKRKDYRDIAKLGFAPALFNISEPIMFGLPVVMNPILIIPMVLVTIVSMFIGYISTMIGFMGYTYVLTPWTTPPIIGAFLSTGGSIGAVVTAVICLVVSVLIYMPFVKVMDKANAGQIEE